MYIHILTQKMLIVAKYIAVP